MTTPVDPSARPAWFGESSSAPGRATSQDAAGKDAFLRLLVAQIKHQNPLNPADGTEFLTQLAQFSELEQIIEIREQLEALRQDLRRPAVAGDGD